MFCPEKGKGESEASEAMRDLCTRGRKRLLCPLFATQRLATLSKDASSMLLNRMIGPTFEDINRKRAVEILSITKEDQGQFLKEIQLLEPGNFYALGRAICKERTLLRVGEIETPHGEEALKYETAPPPPPEKVKALLPKLADLPKAAEEKAKTEAELRTEIRSLKAQLRAQPTTSVTTAPDRLTVRKIAEMEALVSGLKKYAKETEDFISFQGGILAGLQKTIGHTLDKQPPDFKKPKGVDLDKYVAPGSSFVNPKPFVPVPRFASDRQPTYVPGDNHKLRSGAERMLAALAQWAPNGMSEGQMRAHAGLKKSGTFSAYMSDLRRGAYIEERNGQVYATDAGLEYCQHVPAAPSTTDEVLAVWNPKLREGARRMLAVLVEAGGAMIGKEELGERAGLRKSGTFSAYLSDLKTARLVVVSRDGVAANRETLFL